jgi:AlwI restriction endonuclease
MRIKTGLAVLAESPLNGNLDGRENENAFAHLLYENGVVTLARLDDDPNADVSDLGRKWRAVMMQLGFITDAPYTITDNGRRLIESMNLPPSTVLPAEQDCFLRSLLAYQIPSPIEPRENGPVFSPLRIVLEVLAALEEAGMNASISKGEMAGIIQLTRRVEDIGAAVEAIANLRDLESREQIPRNRKRVVIAFLERVARNTRGQQAGTLADYADSNFRYLKVTGLFSERGSCLELASHKRTIINQILSRPFAPIPDDEYKRILWAGAELPTDSRPQAIEAIESLATLLRDTGQPVRLPSLIRRPAQELVQLRLGLEGQYTEVLEGRYAEQQATQWEEILAYLRAVSDIRNSRIIPRGEGPAYLEWSVWRAFLAIDSLSNRPWEARRFRVDQDFHPIGPAPSNGPDAIFEFDEFVVVVEVTLTSSSRQEAAEGEPVRRHVARLVDEYERRGKRVYGLFLANEVDTNTAETFRIGVWYRPDDSRLTLRIVPFTVKQFADLFEAGFRRQGRLAHSILEEVIRDCRAESNADAPDWKRLIDQRIGRTIQRLN